MIPRVLHFIWVGGSTIPDKLWANVLSWRRYHPGWRIILWSDAPEKQPVTDGALRVVECRPIPALVNEPVIPVLDKLAGRGKWAGRSDLIRYELVARYGGVYMDVDVVCLGKIDQLLENVRLFVCDEVGFNGTGAAVGNYGFGAHANHPAMWTVVRELPDRIRAARAGANLVEISGPVYLNQQLGKYDDLVIFPWRLFCPLPPQMDEAEVTEWPACSVANHNFEGTWYDRQKVAPSPSFLKGASDGRQRELDPASGDSQSVGAGTGCACCKRAEVLADSRRIPRSPSEKYRAIQAGRSATQGGSVRSV